MDIADVWRTLRRYPADTPRAGVPWAGFPVLGFDAQVDWADGAPQSITLDYVLLECNPWVWWPARFIDVLIGTFARNR